MTNKEFKRLNRAQLIEIIYQLQLKQDELINENKELTEALTDKRLRISEAGNIADAAVEINDCFRSAQEAAEQYLEEIKTLRAETEAECDRILSEARKQAEEIISRASETREEHDTAIDAFLMALEMSRTDNDDGDKA